MNDALGRSGELLLQFNPLLQHIVKHWEKTDCVHQVHISVLKDGYVEIRSSSSTEEAVLILASALGVALSTLSHHELNFAKNLPDSQKKVLGFG